MSEISEIEARIRKFAIERNWEDFHTPKNLAMAITGEAGELAAEFQWLTPDESCKLNEPKLEAVSLEIADIAIYLIRLADITGINLIDCINKKMTINEDRFPA